MFLPAYNEEESVESVIDMVYMMLPEARVVVVNDGSSDQTAWRAQQRGATVLDLPFNLGIGGAVQTGLKFAQRGGFDVAVEVDADGQHDPHFIQQLIQELERSGSDMVIGSRFASEPSYRSSQLRLVGIRLFAGLIRLVTGRRINDSTSGFRAYNRRAINFLSQRYPADFPEPESIVMLLNAGYRVQETSVIMHKRTTGQSVVGKSDFSWKGAYFVLSNAIAILVSGLKPKTHD